MQYLGRSDENVWGTYKGSVKQKTQKAKKEDEGDTSKKKNSREAYLWEDPGRDQSGRNQTERKMKRRSGMCRKAKKKKEHLV